MDQKCSQSHGKDVWAPVDAEAIGVHVRLCREAAEAQGVALLSIAPAEALTNPEKPQISPIPAERDSWLWRGDGHPAQVPHMSPRRARSPVSHQSHISLAAAAAAPQSPSSSSVPFPPPRAVLGPVFPVRGFAP